MIHIINDVEWKKGKCDHHMPKDKELTIVATPIRTQCMYPMVVKDAKKDLIYACCVKCGNPMLEGCVCIVFHSKGWGIRVSCCHEAHVNTKIPIISIQDVLEPVINNGFEHGSTKCDVCERKNCKSPECKEILDKNLLYPNVAEQWLSHFYSIRLDIITPLLVGHMCDVCGEKKGVTHCGDCRLRTYCGKSCKKKDGHKCEHKFWELWRG